MIKTIITRITSVAITILVMWWLGIKGIAGLFMGMALMAWILLTNNQFVMVIMKYFENVETTRKFWGVKNNGTTNNNRHEKQTSQNKSV